MKPLEILKAAGWTEVGSRRHPKWRCPCGKHQVSFPSTPSDWRNDRNMLRDIRGTGCPSIEALEPDPERPWPEGTELVCYCCKRTLVEGRYKKDWVYHDGMFACLAHQGVEKWHRSRCREKRKNGDGRDDLEKDGGRDGRGAVG